MSASDGAQPVGDDERRAPREEARHVLLDRVLRLRVERARGLVEDQDRRVDVQCPGDADALLLPTREQQPGLPDAGFVAQGKLPDEIVRVGELCGPDRTVAFWLGVAERDVAEDRAIEQVVLLQDHPDVAAKLPVVEAPHVDAVEEHGSLGRLEQSREAFDQRGLPAAAASDDGDGAAGGDVQRDAAE
jgi:hypothetical protein